MFLNLVKIKLVIQERVHILIVIVRVLVEKTLVNMVALTVGILVIMALRTLVKEDM